MVVVVPTVVVLVEPVPVVDPVPTVVVLVDPLNGGMVVVDPVPTVVVLVDPVNGGMVLLSIQLLHRGCARRPWLCS